MLLAPISALDLPKNTPTITTVEGAEEQPEVKEIPPINNETAPTPTETKKESA